MGRAVSLNVCLLAILFSSCYSYKKLYNVCLEDKKQMMVLNSLAISQNNAAKSRHGTLASSYEALGVKNKELTEEKDRLRTLEIKELEQVSKAIAAYFDLVARKAYSFLPPCPNATNGHFTDRMAEDNDVRVLGDPQLSLETRSANDLLNAFKSFSAGNRSAFVTFRNDAPSGTRAAVLWTEDYLGEVMAFIAAAVSAINSDGDDNKKNQQVAIAAKNLYLKVNENGKCHSGRHGNGHVALAVHNAAMGGLDLANKSYAASPQAVKVKNTLINTFRMLAQLQTQGHFPWLNGDWQLKYYLIMNSAQMSLKDDTLNHN